MPARSMLRVATAAAALLGWSSGSSSTPHSLTDEDMDMLKECVKHKYVLTIDLKTGEGRTVEGIHGPCAFALVRKLYDGDNEEEEEATMVEVPLASKEAPVTMPMLDAMLTVGKYHLESILGEALPKPPKIPVLQKPFLNDTLADAGVPGVVASAIDDFVDEKVMEAMNLLKAADLVEFPELMELAAAKTSLLLRPLFSAKDFNKALDELIPPRPGAEMEEHEEDVDVHAMNEDVEMKETMPVEPLST